MDNQKYTIGQISELCDISKKQLRYYDEIGLLTPKFRNSETNYRYYTYEQVEEVLLIKELRRLDVPLKDIEKLFENRNIFKIQEILKSHLTSLKEEIIRNQKKYDDTVELLLRITSNSNFCTKHPQNEIGIVEVEEKRVCQTRDISICNAKSGFLYRRAELLKIIDKLQIRTKGPNGAIFHNDYMAQFDNSSRYVTSDLEVFFEIENEPSDIRAREFLRTIPHFRAVSCIHFGHYKDMMPAYEDMISWAKSNDVELSCKSMEKYIVGATNTDNSDEYVTRLYIPLAGEEI